MAAFILRVAGGPARNSTTRSVSIGGRVQGVVERALPIPYSARTRTWMRRSQPRFRRPPDATPDPVTRKGKTGSMGDTRQVIILGSGAAGLTAAIYAARA